MLLDAFRPNNKATITVAANSTAQTTLLPPGDYLEIQNNSTGIAYFETTPLGTAATAATGTPIGAGAYRWFMRHIGDNYVSIISPSGSGSIYVTGGVGIGRTKKKATAAPVGTGASLSISNFGIYSDAGFTTLMINGTNIADITYTPGSYTGAPYTGISGHSPPMAGSISAAAPPSSFSISATDNFVFTQDVSAAVYIQFNASYHQSSYPTGTSVIALEAKIHDDTASSYMFDWLPMGNGSITQGVVIADPVSMNRTIATASTISGLFQARTNIPVQGHTFTLTVTMSVTNS